MGLTDSFSQVRTKVLLMDPIPSLSKVYSLLIQDETQRSVPNASVTKVDSTVLDAKMPNDHHGTNLASTSSGGKGKDKPICTHCGKTGHRVDKCTNPPWPIKSRQAPLHNSCLLPLQCITKILPLHLNSANNFLLVWYFKLISWNNTSSQRSLNGQCGIFQSCKCTNHKC